MSIEIVQRPAFTVVGLSILTKPKSPEIPAMWPKFVARIPDIAGQSEPRVTYGVMQHQQPDSLLYMAAVAVTPPAKAPQGLEVRQVPAGAYARFSYPLSRLAESYNEIFGRLLPSSKVEQRVAPLLERYGETFCPDDTNSPVEILIPVKQDRV